MCYCPPSAQEKDGAQAESWRAILRLVPCSYYAFHVTVVFFLDCVLHDTECLRGYGLINALRVVIPAAPGDHARNAADCPPPLRLL